MSLVNDFKRFYKITPVTTVVILLAVAVSLLTLFGNNYQLVSLLIYNNELIASGQIWRLITPIFLHFSMFGVFFLHLAFNLLWFWQFAKPIEMVLGSRFLVIFIISTGVASNVAQSFFTDGIFGGLSGVVYALLGFLWLLPKLDKRSRLSVPDNIAYFLIIFMVISALGILGPGIANAAHIGGFVSGLLFALIQSKRNRAKPSQFIH